jgi:Phage tail tube protein
MADTTSLLAGTAYVTVDGQSYLLEGSIKWVPSTVKRETVTGMDGVHGYKETPIPGSISGSFRDTADISAADFNKMTNVTVQVELANGKMVVGRNMWTVDSQEVDSAEATVEVKWEGPLVEEA